jgi:hypothetical protein
MGVRLHKVSIILSLFPSDIYYIPAAAENAIAITQRVLLGLNKAQSRQSYLGKLLGYQTQKNSSLLQHGVTFVRI